MKKYKNIVIGIIVFAFICILAGASILIVSIALKKENNPLLYTSIGLMATGGLIYLIIFTALAIAYKKKG